MSNILQEISKVQEGYARLIHTAHSAGYIGYRNIDDEGYKFNALVEANAEQELKGLDGQQAYEHILLLEDQNRAVLLLTLI